MNKRVVTSLFIALGTCFALHTPSTYAGVSVGGACDANKGLVCAAGLECSNATCQYPSDKIGGDLQQCKNKLIENGMSSGAKASLYQNTCYDTVSCPGVYDNLYEFAKLKDEPETRIEYGADSDTPGGYQKEVATGANAKREAFLKAAVQACSQCTSGGKPRCFYPAMKILY
ncbi:hypothetical protein [Pseudomonas bharatica]|uniref:hypothetical protein n=1 Tax=Pseudomonas bharatica TaxID=2692112 RepID=UPI003B28B076